MREFTLIWTVKSRPGRFPFQPWTKAEAWLSSALPGHPPASRPWSFFVREDRASLREDAYAGGLSVCSSGPWVRTERQKAVCWSRNGHLRACFHRSPVWPRVSLSFPRLPLGCSGAASFTRKQWGPQWKGDACCVCLRIFSLSLDVCPLCTPRNTQTWRSPGSTMQVGRASWCYPAEPRL